ncbi:MAG: FeoB-associated Cys-rich membrane protein [Firmicutes bacterium]|nr:FeoB-associated Cys-rich membrane protein [Bacillota bacterium]
MTDLIVGGILLVILGLAIAYIVKEKKAGAVCVGCPHAGSCASARKAKHSEGSCSCHCEE